MFKPQLDILAIGDITIDAFIHIADKDAKVICPEHKKGKAHGYCELCLEFPDKVPFESMTEVAGVGNSANAAVSAARLGLRAALVTTVGNDARGQTCINSLKENSVDTEYIHTQKNIETNYHYALWYQADRTILINHHEYNYLLPRLAMPPKWIYLSSLASNSYPYHMLIADYLKKNPTVQLAFQPGTFQMKLGTTKLAELYKMTAVFIVNLEESQLILNTNDADVHLLLEGLYKLGPRIVLITDGPKGAYMYDGGHTYFMPIYPDQKPPYERTGCGDAFASTFISALALGKSPLEALAWAPINPMSVVEYIGAQEGLLNRRSLEHFLKKAPSHYKPTIYNSFLKKQS